MFLPTGQHHILLMRNPRHALWTEAGSEHTGPPVIATRQGLIRRIRHIAGQAVIGLGHRIRGPVGLPADGTPVST